MTNAGEDQQHNPLIRLLFGLLLGVYVVVMGLFKVLAGIFGFWVIVAINIGIILLAAWINPTLGRIVTDVVFGYWLLWLLLKLVFLVGGKHMERMVSSKLDAALAKKRSA